jgi:hypothetical protein
MDIKKALKLLGLNSSATTGELNTVFRKLAKKYHPDFNPKKESWAHTMMIELNQAYETALQYLTSPHQGQEADTQKTYRAYRESFSSRFNGAVDKVLQAVYLFYEYGLENVHLRREGVRRFRYRESVNNLRMGIKSLEALRPLIVTKINEENLKVFIDFANAFLQNMLIDKFHNPGMAPMENDAHRHYRNGSEHLDYAIKDVFFGDRLIRTRDGSFYRKISLSYEEFLIVVSKYHSSSWITETVMKIYLLELLTRVIKIFKRMRY